MSSIFGNKLKISVFGQSHSAGIGIVIDGLPAGTEINLEDVKEFMKRRAPTSFKNNLSTARKEDDEFEILSGIKYKNDSIAVACGAPLCSVIYNKDQRSRDYDNILNNPRPGHADYTANIKYKGFEDHSGGGHFSGRLTAPLCFAGAVCMQYLNSKGIYIGAHIKNIGKIYDDIFDPLDITFDDLCKLTKSKFPVFNKDASIKMEEQINMAHMELDSVGGSVECFALGVPAGLGEPMFDSIDSRLAHMMFCIPGVKGVAVGKGFEACELRGSQNNDEFYVDDEGNIKTRTNNCGGILGGISNGMPISVTVGFKPTPSIGIKQKTVDLVENKDSELQIKGRHDPCITLRAVPVVEACMAIVISDHLV